MSKNPFEPIILEPVEKNCPKHGSYMAERMKIGVVGNSIIYSMCPKCELSREAIEKFHEKKDFAKLMHIPERFLDVNFDSFIHNDNEILVNAKTTALEFVRSTRVGRNLLILGPSDIGKTHLAAMILNMLQEQSARYTNIINILDAIKNSYSTKRSYLEERTEYIQGRYATMKFLVIDNIERFQPTADNKKLLFSLIDSRYNNNVSTIVCGSTTELQLRKLIGQGLYNRLTTGGRMIDMFPQQKLF